MTGRDGAPELEQRLGIFARVFRRNTAAEVAAAVAAAGYRLAHWNYAAIGKPTLYDDPHGAAADAVRQAFAEVGVGIPSVSATYNMIHPNPDLRGRTNEQAARFITGVAGLGADVVTLCTGTRNAQNMWGAHPDNRDQSAWSDFRRSMDVLLDAARDARVHLGVEPEPGNVVRDAPTAARLLEELGQDAPVGIVLDPANLLTPGTVDQQDDVVGEAIDLLGSRVVGTQAKDVVASGYAAAGAGLLDYPTLLAQLAVLPPVPMIVQDADEGDAARVRHDLLRWNDLRAAPRQRLPEAQREPS